jgi:DNA-binding transcriptional regulator YiaG
MRLPLVCCGSVTFRKKRSDPQLAVEATQRNLIGAIRVQPLRISSRFRKTMMSASFRSKTQETLTQELRKVATSSPAFDRDLATKIGTRVAMRRSLCGHSKLQLAARLGIDAAEVSAYEQGEKRMSCKLLLETAKQLNARPRFFFQ